MEAPHILKLLLLTLLYPFVLHFLLLRWFNYRYRNFITTNIYLFDTLKEYNIFVGPVAYCFTIGIFNFAVWLPLTILLSPVFIVFMLYAIVYWTVKRYIIQ